ncbi:WD repeat-containing protein [Venturia inaequalis]|uniref:Uncharacterized protein n=1 Tax=Venturia inaequalis TaxID=5025 RepID=A0A8H3Z636_VENIN|nr:hypothetical protein EG327_006036 [Venturia inaequalis]RDI82718.1 WD repeat-containing protein [Venturia inaequalis]
MNNLEESEHGTDKSPAAADEPNTSQESEGEEITSRSKFSNMIYNYLFKHKTGTDTADPNKPAPLTVSDNTQKRSGRYPRPEMDLKLKYPPVDTKELEPVVLERYNTRVQQMSKRLSGSLRAAGRIGTMTFMRDLAEEIVGTDLRIRKHVDKLYCELLGEIGQAFDEEHEQDQRWGPLETRPSLISQRINEEEDGEKTQIQTSEWHTQTLEYGPGEKARGKRRVV